MRALWVMLKVLLGTLCVVAAFAALFVVVGAYAPTRSALAAALVVLLVSCVLVNQLFTLAYRRLDADAGWWSNLPGVSALLSLLALIALGVWARVPLALGLRTFGARHATLGPGPARFASRLSAWLERASPSLRPPAPAPHDAATPTDASLHDAFVSPEASVVATPDAAAVDSALVDAPEALDAATDNPVDAAALPEAPELPDASPADEGAPSAFAGLGNVRVCGHGGAAWPVAAGGGGPDGVVVHCSDGVHVVRVADEAVQEVLHLLPRQPEGVAIYVHDVAVLDADHDGREDLLLCTLGLSERGGTRPGGGVYWSRQVGALRFAAPVRLFAVDCASLAVGDVVGNTDAEIVVADYGNPYSPTRTAGYLRWYGGRGSRWSPLGVRDTRAEPERLWLGDVDGDGHLDAMIAHLTATAAGLVFPNAGRGFGAPDEALTATPAPDRHEHVPARLDGDNTPDEVALGDGELFVRRSVPFAGPINALGRAAEMQEFTF